MLIPHIHLFHYRWAIPILAEILRNQGIKFIYLHKKLVVNKSVLSKTLQELIKNEYIIRNPGYGHPLRPEYILHQKSLSIAQSCLDLYNQLVDAEFLDLLKSKWNLPILSVLQLNQLRFSEIKQSLGNITSRSLILALKHLEEMDYLKRTVSYDYPPIVQYKTRKKTEVIISMLEPFSLQKVMEEKL